MNAHMKQTVLRLFYSLNISDHIDITKSMAKVQRCELSFPLSYSLEIYGKLYQIHHQ